MDHEALDIQLALARYLGDDGKATALARAICEAVDRFHADGWTWSGGGLCDDCRDSIQDMIDDDEGRLLQHIAAELRTPECYEDRKVGAPLTHPDADRSD